MTSGFTKIVLLSCRHGADCRRNLDRERRPWLGALFFLIWGNWRDQAPDRRLILCVEPSDMGNASILDSEMRVMPDRKKPQQRHGFRTNEYIVYPAHGVGRIVSIEEQEIAGA